MHILREKKYHIIIFSSETGAEIIFAWSTFRIMWDIPIIHSRWLPLLLAVISNDTKKEPAEIVQ
jgi:predicted mannosyl-3-phosphoglycerate phosphatase (HAD superfamily)